MTFHCKLQLIQGCQLPGYERCVKCGHLFCPGEPRLRECDKPNSERQVANLPSYVAMAAKFVQAYATWRAKGQPVVELPVIVNNFRECSSCENYSDLSGQCCVCGCFVNLLHNGQGMNKLEWATERCPLPQPRWSNRPEEKQAKQPNDKPKAVS